MSRLADTATGLGGDLHALLTELFPITRSLTGPGYRATLARLEEVSGPMERHRFATGEPVLDWTIPKEWTVRDAWIEGPDGARVCSLSDSNLHVVSYSVPVRERLSLDALQAHLHSLPDSPEAIPYRTTYYNEDWGFCLAHSVRERLPEGEYEVCVDADLGPGEVVLGEVVVPGASDAEVLFSTYCCHPSLANNELSGPVVVSHLARLVASLPEPRLTYRFLFVPETIGTIAYLARFGDRLRKRLAAGYVVTCVGDPAPFHYKRSRRAETLADRAAEHVLAHGSEPYEVLDFFPFGSDERQFCSPGFDLPVGSLMRSVYGYPGYHTSLDDLDLVEPEALAGSLAAYVRIVEALEANETFRSTQQFGEPQLGRRGLYPETGGQIHPIRDTLWALNLCDGSRDLLTVADRAARPIQALRTAAEPLIAAGLLERIDA